eukprot:TRINITY_DN7569_c0_g1_i3.p1 TRINITY_DN7569_c0_g1~~TRINITY_DN7569_c0_g1_i3.p1  ORF type:complete len:177 (+),score=30.47 TRINITY_DN7569_c0_g1_i3:102-632(+)
MDTPSKPRLIYFNIKARAEPIRQAYHYGQVDFEDMRVSKDEFTALKDAGKCPSGQLPVLQLPSGETLSQSWAILRYVGRQTGLYPKDDMEAYKVDATFNLVEDVVGKLVPSLRESDPEKKMAMRKELAETILPQVWPCVHRQNTHPSKDTLLTASGHSGWHTSTRSSSMDSSLARL